MKEVLITGGAGFVGSHLAETLLKKDTNIIIVDDFSNGAYENLDNIKDSVIIHKFDITQPDWDLLNGYNPNVIFHLATHPRSFSLQDPTKNAQVNVLGTINVLEFAKKKKSKIIYTSNSGICGDPQFFPVTEEHPVDCKTPYDANKLVGEYYMKIYYKIYGVYSITFRLATVYGERQKVNESLGWRPLIASLVKQIESGNIPTIQWDGEQTRDLIYVKDVVDCLIMGSNSSDYGGEMFLLSTNTETSVNRVFELVCKITKKQVKPRYEKKIEGDLRRMVLSYEKAHKAFGYEPKISLEEGIRKYIDWYHKHNMI